MLREPWRTEHAFGAKAVEEGHLRMTRMPAVRLDCGYLSHPVDRLLLLDARLRSTIAHAVLAAVQRLYLPAEADPATGTFVLPLTP